MLRAPGTPCGPLLAVRCSLPGAMLGGIILGISESLFSGLINSDYKDVFSFSLLVVILIFRPQGLLGRPLVAKV